MGSDHGTGRGRAARVVAVAAVVVLALVGCTSDPEPQQATVTLTKAYTAIVRWEIERTEPVVDEAGDVEVPVIYVAEGSGATVDVRVQADVVSAIDDAAVIRFVDDAGDARNEDLDNEPVKDDGVMIIIDDFEPDQPSAEVRIVRYRSIDEKDAWTLEITANDDGAAVESAALALE